MVLLSDAVNFKKLDSRLVERNIAKGVLTQAELETALQQLPDDAENAEWVEIASFEHDSSDAGSARESDDELDESDSDDDSDSDSHLA